MGIRRVVFCNIKDCNKESTEEYHGKGWPGWGLIKGKKDTETGEEEFYLCPDDLNTVFDFALSLGGVVNGMD